MTLHVYGLFAYFLISYLYMYLLVHLTDMSSNPHRKRLLLIPSVRILTPIAQYWLVRGTDLSMI